MRDESADRNLPGGEHVSIGIGATLSGKYAAIGREMKQAATLAIEGRNATGGILGATLAHTLSTMRAARRQAST